MQSLLHTSILPHHTQHGLQHILDRGPRIDQDAGQLLSVAGAIDFTQRVEAVLASGKPDWNALQHHLEQLLSLYTAPHWHAQPLLRAKTQNLVRCHGEFIAGGVVWWFVHSQHIHPSSMHMVNSTHAHGQHHALPTHPQVLDVIHYLDVVEVLRSSKCTRVDAWAWKKQLRFYASPAGVGALAGGNEGLLQVGAWLWYVVCEQGGCAVLGCFVVMHP